MRPTLALAFVTVMKDIETEAARSTTPPWARGRELEIPKCTLIIENGPQAGTRHELGARTTIGRKGWCDVGIDDPKVSRLHCEIVWSPEGMRIRDLGSTNGVEYYNTRVCELIMMGNCSFRIGSTRFRVEFDEGTNKEVTPSLDPSGSVIGTSEPMQRIFSLMRRVAYRDAPVLLLGETGTGKTSLARAIHKLSSQRDEPFVEYDCASVTSGLIESTLFGHVRGAFTGAERYVPGIFEQAGRGAVFLDEIGDMPLELQGKLLKVLDTHRVRPLGSNTTIPVDFRLYCATNRNLAADVKEGRFREDLFFRLNVMPLRVPPLRERGADIGLLAQWFTHALSKQLRSAVTGISPKAIAALEGYSWPGNVRELFNAIDRAITLADTATLQPEDFQLDWWALEAAPQRVPAGSPCMTAAPSDEVDRYAEFKALMLPLERAWTHRIAARTDYNISRAAELTGLSRTHVRALFKKHGVKTPGGG